jgi:hypothetical protein
MLPVNCCSSESLVPDAHPLPAVAGLHAFGVGPIADLSAAIVKRKERHAGRPNGVIQAFVHICVPVADTDAAVANSGRDIGPFPVDFGESGFFDHNAGWHKG